MDHHNLDIYPEPRDNTPLYINEPWIIDETADIRVSEPDPATDNVRVYVPLDLNRETIIRRLQYIKSKYGDVDWRNETSISVEIALLIHQIEIYDQVHYVRHMPKATTHPSEKAYSIEATSLVKEFIKELEEIDSSGDTFPYDKIEELRKEFDL